MVAPGRPNAAPHLCATSFTTPPRERTVRRAETSEAPERMSVRDGVAVIAGSALGGGFLALPLVTQPMGFLRLGEI